MSAPIGSVNVRPIQIPDGGSSRGEGESAHQRSGLRGHVTETHFVDSQEVETTRSQLVNIQKRLQEAGSNVRVGVETVNGNTIFTIRDAATGQIIRRIPSDEALRISQNLDKLTGLYLDRLE